MNERERYNLALQMVSELPKWGQWATGFRDFETPWGKVGFRQLAILWALRYEQIPQSEFSPSRLAQLHDVQPSVITRALARLEAGQFIERKRDPNDGRSYRIVMTERGRELSVYVEKLYVDDITSAFARYSDDDLEMLRSSIAKLTQIVSQLESRQRFRIQDSANDYGAPKDA